MRKLFFIIAAILMAASVWAEEVKQEVTFMGIPLSYTYEQFTAELAQKVQPKYIEELQASFVGKFEGINDCDIDVLNNLGNVGMIIVRKTRWCETVNLMNLKNMYDERYGEPTIPIHERDGIVYSYRAGDTQIDILFEKGDIDIPSKVTALTIIYRPLTHETTNPSDDI